jgi:hypothetical protein
MAPKPKGESALQRAVKLQAQAAVLEQKGTLDLIRKHLAEHPELIPFALSSIEKEIAKREVTAGVPMTPRPSSPGAPSRAGSLEQLSPLVDGSPSGPVDPLAVEPPLPVPQCYHKLENLSVKLMKVVLADFEPIVFSHYSIRALVKRGQRDVAKANLSELIEYCCDVDPSSSISADERDIAKLTSTLKVIYIHRGSIAAKLRLPPDWDKDGYFGLSVDGDEVVLIALKTEEKITLPPTVLKGVDIKKLYIDRNYSESRATLKETDTLFSKAVQTLFLTMQGEGAEAAPSEMLGSACAAAAVQPKKKAKLERKKSEPKGGTDFDFVPPSN